jgi:hypothetical protein
LKALFTVIYGGSANIWKIFPIKRSGIKSTKSNDKMQLKKFEVLADKDISERIYGAKFRSHQKLKRLIVAAKINKC